MKVVRRLCLPLAVTLWSMVVLTGFLIFHAYNNAPGSTGPVPIRIGGDSDQSSPQVHSLLLFAHPHCPCTSVTLSELASLLAINRSPIEVNVWFIHPKGTPAGWEHTSLWRAATAIPGVKVSSDEEGALARSLGAETSGQVILYDPHGRLQFKGGITRARGQVGDSPGRRAILDHVAGSAAMPQSPVFGCPLFASNECCGEGEALCRP